MAYFMNLLVWASASGLGLLICSSVLGYLKLQRNMRRNGCFSPSKYPHKDPLLGLDVFFDDAKARNRGDSASKERERFRNYGKTFQVNSWGKRCIHTMDVANTQAILSQLFDRFGVEPLRLHIGEPFIGKGVFSTDGAYWRQSRELIKPIFARAQISDFAALDVHLSHMIDRIPTDGSTVDLQALLKLMVFLSSPP